MRGLSERLASVFLGHLAELGLSMSAAVNAFLKALVREGGMPFEMKVGTNEGSTRDDG